MNTLTVVLPYSPQPWFRTTLNCFLDSSLVEKVLVVHNGSYNDFHPKCEGVKSASFTCSKTLSQLVDIITTEYFLYVTQSQKIELSRFALRRMLTVAEQAGVGMVYSDYYEVKNGVRSEHPVNDYQLGSIRDNFDFGSLILFATAAVKKTIKKYKGIEAVQWSALYDVRLKISIDHIIFRIPEFLYTKTEFDVRKSGEKQFNYVDPGQQQVQSEMEKVVTKHLKQIDAYLKPKFEKVPKFDFQYPVEASVVIPVRNRLNTIGDAVKSVLEQKTDFLFNCIIIDNYSSDGTTYLLRELAARNQQVEHLIPHRTDLGIGGCWNEALYSEFCGRYAVQLDSDDVYSRPDTLQKIVREFHHGNYAMVIGSYKLVNMRLEELPPGIIDHKEWTPENGRNNALRINGLGAPRAYNTALLREMGGLPNVSYGEDYAMAIRLSRQFQIGRIYEPLYLCRRWEGNTDSALTVEKANRNDHYKDTIRTMEILARQKLNRKKK